MDILIFSVSFGRGLRQAANVLEARLTKACGDECRVEVVDVVERFAPSLQVLAKFAYQQTPRFFPDAVGTFAELALAHPDDPVVRELEQTAVEQVAAYLERRAPDAVVSVHALAASMAAQAKSRAPHHCVSVMTDWALSPSWIHPAIDTHCVATPEMKDSLAARGLPWGDIHVTGVPIDESFETTPSPCQARSAERLEERFTALVMTEGMTPAEVDGVCGSAAAIGVQVVGVAARQPKPLARLRTLAERHVHVRAIGWTDRIAALMAAADVMVLGAGGATMAEAAAVGLPQVFLGPPPGQELANVDFLVDSGAALAARDEQDAVAKLDFLAHHRPRLEELAAAARRLGRPRAARRLCDLVLETVRRRLEG